MAQTQSAGLRALWLRATALLCLLFCLGTAVAQAGHIHRLIGSSHARATASSLDRCAEGEDDSCPLCGSLHFTALVGRSSLPLGLIEQRRLILPLHAHPPQRPLPFHLSSRPPPIS